MTSVFLMAIAGKNQNAKRGAGGPEGLKLTSPRASAQASSGARINKRWI